MRGPAGAGAVGAAATTGGGAAAPAASWARADTGIVTARARAAAGSSSFRLVLVVTVVMSMAFSFRYCVDSLWGLSHGDGLRCDGERPGDGSVAGGMFRVGGDGEGPEPLLAGSVAGRVGDARGESRLVGRARLQQDPVGEQPEGAGADLIHG